jgi:pyridoxamine 5'-phosphate oxidase
VAAEDAAPAVLDAPDPIAALHDEREAARAAQDANAELCWLATADADGLPSVRTIVLRDVDGSFALFVNATSPKWHDMSARPQVQIVCWYPSLQRQWRLRARVLAFPHEVVSRHWHRRPRITQVLDHLYAGQRGQSTSLPPALDLDGELATLDATLPERPEVPVQSLALQLVPEAVECMQLRTAPRIHLRRRWLRAEAADTDEPRRWTTTPLVP